MRLEKYKLSCFVLALCLLAPLRLFAGNVIYQYDSLNRLVRVEYPNHTTIEYTYDAAGNILTRTVDVDIDTDGDGLFDN